MDESSMSIVEKIELRQSQVEEALRQETDTIDQALSKLKQHLNEQINKEVNSLKLDLERQEKEHYQAIKLHLQAIEQAIGIEVEVKRRNGKIVSEVYDIKESFTDQITEKIKFWEK